jgi:phage FluMu protein Com
MSKKLKNIKAVNEMILGEHKTQTKKVVSFDESKFIKREVGATWVDDKGQT